MIFCIIILDSTMLNETHKGYILTIRYFQCDKAVKKCLCTILEWQLGFEQMSGVAISPSVGGHFTGHFTFTAPSALTLSTSASGTARVGHHLVLPGTVLQDMSRIS